MAQFDTTSPIYLVFEALTNNITGSLFLTMLFVCLLAIIFLMIFRLPLDVSVILVAPLFIVVMAFNGEFVAVGGALLIALAFIFSKKIFPDRYG